MKAHLARRLTVSTSKVDLVLHQKVADGVAGDKIQLERFVRGC